MKTLKQFITKYNEQNNYDTSNEGLFETFEECFDVVWKELDDERRWYHIYNIVIKINIDYVDRFFEYQNIIAKGEDANRYDSGFEIPDLNDVKEVFKKEKVIFVYE